MGTTTSSDNADCSLHPLWDGELGHEVGSPSPTWHACWALAPHFWHETTWACAPERHLPAGKQSAPKKWREETFHQLLTQSIHQQIMFCDINSGTNSTLGLKSRPTRSKLQGNWAAPWDNQGSESIRLIPIRPSHPKKSLPAAEKPVQPLSGGVTACVSPPAILSGAFWREAQQTLCGLIWQGARDPSGKSSGQQGQTDSFGTGERFPCSLQGSERQKAARFRPLWVSPAVLMADKLLKVGRPTYTRTSCCY